LDASQPHFKIAKRGMHGIEFTVLHKIGGDISQVHLAEGFHKLMDRKLESGLHGADNWLLHAMWIHYNFIEIKDDLFHRTPAEAAGYGTVFFHNSWHDLIRQAKTWLELECKGKDIINLKTNLSDRIQCSINEFFE
jgi:hypothetical protein